MYVHLLSGLVTCQKVTNLTCNHTRSQKVASLRNTLSQTRIVYPVHPQLFPASSQLCRSKCSMLHQPPGRGSQRLIVLAPDVVLSTPNVHARSCYIPYPSITRSAPFDSLAFVPRHAIHLVSQRVFSLGGRCASNTTVLTCVPEHVWVKIQYERVCQVYLDADSGFCWSLARHVLYT